VIRAIDRVRGDLVFKIKAHVNYKATKIDQGWLEDELFAKVRNGYEFRQKHFLY